MKEQEKEKTETIKKGTVKVEGGAHASNRGSFRRPGLTTSRPGRGAAPSLLSFLTLGAQ